MGEGCPSELSPFSKLHILTSLKWSFSSQSPQTQQGWTGREVWQRTGQAKYAILSGAPSRCSGAREPTWPLLPQAWCPGAVSQNTRCAPWLPGRWAPAPSLPHTDREGWGSRPCGHACPAGPDPAMSRAGTRVPQVWETASKHQASFSPSQLATGCVKLSFKPLVP